MATPTTTRPPANGAPPSVQQINVRTDPEPRGGGGAGWIVAIVGILAVLAVVYFLFLGNGAPAADELDVNVEVPETQAPDINIDVPEVEVPDVNVEVPDVELPEVELPEAAPEGTE